MLATEKGPLSRVSESSAAVITLSAIQFDCFDTDTDSSDVGNTFVDSALSAVTAVTFIEKISALVATSSVGEKVIFGMINSLLYEDCFFQ